jgi:dTDP-glucose pyrophosphorylase
MPQANLNGEAVRPYVVTEDGSLRDALQALEQAATTICLVVDAEGRLIGTLTDGDVRRALLKEAPLSSPLARFMNRDFIRVGPESSRSEVLDRMRACHIQQIPIVLPDGRLGGLHLMREIIGRAERPNWGVIMAGGLGMRLRPITDHVPKPMLLVAGRPILERLVLHMVGFGIRRIFLAINHLGDVIETHFGDGAAFGCQISYLRESIPLGTAGALTLLPEAPANAVLVMNGDLVTQADLGALIGFHEAGDWAVTVGLRPYLHTVPFGCVALDGNRIVQLEEKPQLSRLVNTGIYAVSPASLTRLPADRSSTMPWLIDQCIHDGEPVGGFNVPDEWQDIGQFDELKRAREGNADGTGPA